MTGNPPPAAAICADAVRMCQLAAQIEADNPRWIVMFGIYSRQFVAFPRFTVPGIAVVTALYPEALPPRLHAAEATTCTASATAPGEAGTVTFRLAG